MASRRLCLIFENARNNPLRQGGDHALAAVAEDFRPRMVKEPQLGDHFVGQGTVSLRRIHQSLTDQLCDLTGGPCLDLHRPMPTMDAGMKTTDHDWDIAVDH